MLLILLGILYLFDFIHYFLIPACVGPQVDPALSITARTWRLYTTIRGCPGGAHSRGSFPLVQGEGWDGVLLYALIVKIE